MECLQEKATNVFIQHHSVDRHLRGKMTGQGFRGCTIWFTGKHIINLSHNGFSKRAKFNILSSMLELFSSKLTFFLLLTGLSGAGKTTISFAVEKVLVSRSKNQI
jgi:adenylylsulfate kinase-like enzyme